MSIAALIIWTFVAGAFVLMIYQHAKGRVELLSLRNFAIIGFLIFQVTSATFALISHDADYSLQDPMTIWAYLLWMVSFAAVFLLVYRWSPGVEKLAHKVPVPNANPTRGTLWLVAIAATGFALIFRFAVGLPYISVLAGMTAIGMASVASGVAGWIWGPRLFNPAVALPALAIVAVNAAIAQGGEFGRRPLVSVGAAMVWGLYWSYFRHHRTPGLLMRLAVGSIIPVMALSAYTSVRTWRSLDLAEQVKLITQYSDVESGLLDLLSGQDGARRSMFLMEEYDKDHGGREMRHLMTIRYFFAYPVPRAMWDDKPYPLSTYVADFASKQGVKRGRTGVTVGPGIIGHAAGEGGFYALMIYASLGGLLLAFFDRVTRLHAYDPFVVIPMGASLGQVMGLARGETSVFTFNWVWAVTTSFIIVTFIAWSLRQMGLLARAQPAQHAAWEEEFADYPGAEDYGDWGEPEPDPSPAPPALGAG